MTEDDEEEIFMDFLEEAIDFLESEVYESEEKCLIDSCSDKRDFSSVPKNLDSDTFFDIYNSSHQSFFEGLLIEELDLRKKKILKAEIKILKKGLVFGDEEQIKILKTIDESNNIISIINKYADDNGMHI